MDNIKNYLFSLQDTKYKEFNCKLMPTVTPDTVIGVRTPQLRAYAKEVFKSEYAEIFLSSLPHTYYEENNLHGFLIEKIKDYDLCIKHLNKFLPFVDNWATCDQLTPKIFKKHTDKLLKQIEIWINSEHTYSVRFAIKMLMAFYLDENFKPAYPKLVASIKSDEYYINMMIAWYFATALAKQYNETIPYLENKTLDKWIHNKTIQKAVESYRITDEQKTYLRTLKIK